MSDTTTLQLEALDTLFFKDGKPFSMGEDTWADGIFPPPPSVVYGALRTQYLSANPETLSVENIDAETTDLEISQIYYRFLERSEANSAGRISANAYFPLPLDIVERDPKFDQREGEEHKNYLKRLEARTRKEKRKKTYEALRLELSNIGAGKTISSNQDGTYFPYWMDEMGVAEPIDYGFIEAGDLGIYLHDPTHKMFQIKKLSDYLTTEPKTGIKRNRFTKSTGDEGELYRVGMRRADQFQLEVAIKPLTGHRLFRQENGEQATIKLGAEGKMANLRLHPYSPPLPIQGITASEFCVYLSTPTILFGIEDKHVPLPDLSFLGEEVIYLGSAIGKPFSLGGFDMKARQPKPMYQVLPAGSIFYFKTKNGQAINFDSYQGRSLTAVGQKEGFGIAYFGKINL